MIPRRTEELRDYRAKALQNGYGYDVIDFLLRLIDDFPEYNWRFGWKFSFRPPRTIVVGPAESNSQLLALHELGHAISQHKSFRMNIERLRMEVEAWERARELAARYELAIDEELDRKSVV